MRVLNPRLDLEDFFSRLKGASQRVLLLDYDGTLAPFHSRPECAKPYPGVTGLVNSIDDQASSRVVMVSGRAMAEMATPLAHIHCTEVWAAHGWQCATPHGLRIDYAPSPSKRRALNAAEASTRFITALGARVERKPGSLAVHWRGLDASAAEAVLAKIRGVWPRHEMRGLEVLEFDGGVELRSRDRTKADAVRAAFVRAAPGAMYAYLGDDNSDEDAFEAIQPRGIGVLVRARPRHTRADLWLSPPQDLVSFLERWRACGLSG